MISSTVESVSPSLIVTILRDITSRTRVRPMRRLYSMAGERGNRKKHAPEDTPEAQARPEESEGREPAGRLPAIPEIARRALSIGLSGFFLTEETIRKALGDSLPKDWLDFAVEQSERTRKEFLERLSFEIAQTLEKADLTTALGELLEGRTLEVRAEIRLGDREGKPTSQEFDVGIKRSKEDK
jgi:hypothetical protein